MSNGLAGHRCAKGRATGFEIRSAKQTGPETKIVPAPPQHLLNHKFVSPLPSTSQRLLTIPITSKALTPAYKARCGTMWPPFHVIFPSFFPRQPADLLGASQTCQPGLLPRAFARLAPSAWNHKVGSPLHGSLCSNVTSSGRLSLPPQCPSWLP